MKADSSQTTSNTITSLSSATTIMQPNHATSHPHSRPSPQLKAHNLLRPPLPFPDLASAATTPDPPQNLFPPSSAPANNHHLTAPPPLPLSPHPPMGYLIQQHQQRNNHFHHQQQQHTSSTANAPHSIPNPPSYSRLPVTSASTLNLSANQHDNPIPTVTPLDNAPYRSSLPFSHPRIAPPTSSPFRRPGAGWPPGPPLLPSNNVGAGAMHHRLNPTRHPAMRHHLPPTGSDTHRPGPDGGNMAFVQQWLDVEGSGTHHNNQQPPAPGLLPPHSSGDNGEGNTTATMDAGMLMAEQDAFARYNNRSRIPRPRPRSNSLTEKEKRERHNAHTKSSRLRIDHGLGRLRDALKKAKPDAKLSKKADIVDAAVRFVQDTLAVSGSGQLHHHSNHHDDMPMNGNINGNNVNSVNPTQGPPPINGLHHHQHHNHHTHHVAVQQHEHDSSLSG